MIRQQDRQIEIHGDITKALQEAADTLLERDGADALTLRVLAARVGVSPKVLYRHFPNRQSLLDDLVRRGLAELHADIARAAAVSGETADRIVHIGGAYMRFAANRGSLLRLMFGPASTIGGATAEWLEARRVVGDEMGRALGDPTLGLAVWATIHGFAMLVLDGVIDVGQHQSGLHVAPSRVEILLRGLVATLRESEAFSR